MARKKKEDKKVLDLFNLGHKEKESLHKKGDFIYIDFEELPGNCLGKTYIVDGVEATLVYLGGDKAKFEVN